MTDPSERPIIFSPSMVRTIYAGRKSQTRRVVTPPPARVSRVDRSARVPRLIVPGADPVACPYGGPGDRLWVRERWNAWFRWDGDERPWHDVPTEARTERRCTTLFYAADGPHGASDTSGWVTPIYMPRWACRLRLRITGVRAEPLQDVSAFDVADEGIVVASGAEENSALAGVGETTSDVLVNRYVDAFRDAWDALQSDRDHRWDANPWVWVVEFDPEGFTVG